MATATTLRYNGVTIENCKTQVFEQSAKYDESGTDKLYNEIKIRVRGVVHTGSTASIGFVGSSATDAAGVYYDCAEKLLEPRKDFYIQLAGGTALNHTAKDDLNNGPKPQDCPIIKVAPGSFVVEFEIVLACECCDSGKNSSGVLSNRWTYDEEQDAEGYLTRNYKGRLRVARATLNPHAFRGWVIPPLAASFQRAAMTFASSTDGLTLDYTITDKEQYAAPPKPARTWSGTHTQSTGQFGITWFEEITIRMNGDRTASKQAMISEAVTIAFNKLDIAGATATGGKPLGGQGGMLQSAAIVDVLDRNSIEFKMQIQKYPQTPTTFGLEGTTLGKPIETSYGYDQTDWPTPKEFGNGSAAAAFVCYLQNPCDDDHKLNNTSTATAGFLPGTTPQGAPGAVVSTAVGTLPIDSALASGFSISHKEHLYTHYQIDSKYETNKLKAQLPLGSSTGDTCVVVSFGAGIGTRLVRVAAERVGAEPEIPENADTLDGSLRGTLLKHWVEPKAPIYTADGKTKLYSVDAYYRYALNRPPRNADQLSGGTLPFMRGGGNTASSSNSLRSADFKTGLLQ